MFFSGYELAAKQIREAAGQRDRLLKAQETAESLTPAHAAAEAAVEAEDGGEAARRRRERVQHEVDPADPYLHEAPEVAHVDLNGLSAKRFSQEGTVPEGYPAMHQVSAEEFRRPPVTADHAAYGSGYETPGQAVPIPSATLAPGMATRPLLTDGRSRPCAPEAC